MHNNNLKVPLLLINHINNKNNNKSDDIIIERVKGIRKKVEEEKEEKEFNWYFWAVFYNIIGSAGYLILDLLYGYVVVEFTDEISDVIYILLAFCFMLQAIFFYMTYRHYQIEENLSVCVMTSALWAELLNVIACTIYQITSILSMHIFDGYDYFGEIVGGSNVLCTFMMSVGSCLYMRAHYISYDRDWFQCYRNWDFFAILLDILACTSYLVATIYALHYFIQHNSNTQVLAEVIINVSFIRSDSDLCDRKCKLRRHRKHYTKQARIQMRKLFVVGDLLWLISSIFFYYAYLDCMREEEEGDNSEGTDDDNSEGTDSDNSDED